MAIPHFNFACIYIYHICIIHLYFKARNLVVLLECQKSNTCDENVSAIITWCLVTFCDTEYIESEFAAKIISSHHKLLLYDIALRNEVAAGQQFLLTDFPRFSRLYSAIVLPDGVEAIADKPAGKKPGKGHQSEKSDICNKFNSGTCKNSNAECKYRHVCKNCGKSDHGKKNCPDGSK